MVNNSWSEKTDKYGETITFVNPYNFVRLGDGVERGKSYDGNCYGKIHCHLVTKTPLCLPDVNAQKQEATVVDTQDGIRNRDHSCTPFFTIDGKPVILGSEIRGVIRNAYETLSNSCMSVNNNDVLSSRSTDVRTPGIVYYDRQRDTWVLEEAEKTKDKRQAFGDHIKRVWVPLRRKRDSKGEIEHSKFYFSPTGNIVFKGDLSRAVEDFNLCMDMYKKNDKAFNDKAFNGSLVTVKPDGKRYPVFYEIVNNGREKVVYLTPSQIGRTVFHNRVSDLIKTYSKCTKADNLCEACSVFGMIGAKNKDGIRHSRVRFSDAYCDNYDENRCLIKGKTLKELAGPKITSLEFYSYRPNDASKMWTFDYDISKYGKNFCDIELRGRKFYLHSKPNYETDVKTNRNITTDLIKENTIFDFDVYFDGVDRSVVDKLVWTLCIGENTDDGKQMHKIGHAKPLGLGSVKIVVDSVSLRSVDFTNKAYEIQNISPEDCLKTNYFDTASGYYSDFMKVTDFDFVKDCNVCYPLGEDLSSNKNSTAGHQWFAGNRHIGSNNGMQATIKYTLPTVESGKLELPSLVKSSSGKNNNYNRERNNKRNYNTNYNSNNSYGSNKNSVEKITVVCDKCGREFQLNKASYDTLVSRGIPIKCWDCRK